MSIKSHKFPVLLFLVAAVAASLVGCAGGGGNNSSSAPPSITSGGATTASQYSTFLNSAASLVTFQTVATSPVTFSHYLHSATNNIACASCHTGDTATGWAAASAVASPGKSLSAAKVGLKMEDMYAGKYCGACHTGQKAFSLKSNCNKCHSDRPAGAPDVKFNIALGGSVDFSHTLHITSYGKTCSDCHSNDTPWPMKSLGGLFTMSDMNAGKSCGKCHAGTVGLDVRNTATCKTCHKNGDSHSQLNPASVDPNACVNCHEQYVTDITKEKGGVAGGLKHIGNDFGHGSVACRECHSHDAVFGKANSHPERIVVHTCQTCHADPTEADGARTKRLRSGMSGRVFCATCHHTRYVYGNPADPGNGPWTAGFPTLPAYSATAKSAWPIEWTSVFYNGDVSKVLTTAATTDEITTKLNVFITRYMSKSGTVIGGGNYPHDSPQYDVWTGATAGTFCLFTKDSNAVALTYKQTSHSTYGNSCVDCHFYKPVNTPSNSGHNLSGGVDVKACYKCHRDEAGNANFLKENEERLAAKITTLTTLLDANNNNAPDWGRSSEDADLKVAMNSVTLTNAQKAILLGAGWNLLAIEGDRSEGIHNPDFVESLLDNTIRVVQQMPAKATW